MAKDLIWDFNSGGLRDTSEYVADKKKRQPQMAPQVQDLAALHAYDEEIAPQVEQIRAEQSLIPAIDNTPWYVDAADTVFNKVPRALSTSEKEAQEWLQKYGAKDPETRDYFTSWSPEEQIYNSAGSIMAAIEGLKKGWNKEPGAVGWDEALKSGGRNETFSNLAGSVLDIVTSPAAGGAFKILGKGATKIIPNAPKLAQSLLGTSMAGATYEGGSQYGETGSGKESAIAGLEGAVTWPLMELGLRGVAGGAKGVVEEYFAPKTGDLLSWRDAATRLGKGATRTTPAVEEVAEPVLGKGAIKEIPEAITAEATTTPAPVTFTSLMEELKPIVEEKITPPMESQKALVNYVYDGFNGQISKNEIRKLSYEELASVA
ncbi:MAG: hypothetical protein ABFD08_15280, partial [Syntrophomonas sp.]